MVILLHDDAYRIMFNPQDTAVAMVAIMEDADTPQDQRLFEACCTVLRNLSCLENIAQPGSPDSCTLAPLVLGCRN